MRKLLLVTVAAAALISQNAMAREAIAIAGSASGCKMVETVTVRVSFNMKANSIADAKVQFDKELAKIAGIAGELKLLNLEPHSINYNINKQNSYGSNSNNAYSISGQAQYKMKSSDVAFKFALMLEKNNLTPNISANAHRQGKCN